MQVLATLLQDTNANESEGRFDDWSLRQNFVDFGMLCWPTIHLIAYSDQCSSYILEVTAVLSTSGVLLLKWNRRLLGRTRAFRLLY
jgi:hypothetical protein